MNKKEIQFHKPKWLWTSMFIFHLNKVYEYKLTDMYFNILFIIKIIKFIELGLGLTVAINICCGNFRNAISYVNHIIRANSAFSLTFI